MFHVKTYIIRRNLFADEYEQLCKRGPGFGPDGSGPDGGFVTG